MKPIASISRCKFSLGLAAAALSGAGHAQNAPDSILKSKTIKIAIPTDYPPYGSIGPDM